MKIVIYTFSDRESGMGHRYRALALATQAEKMGHVVHIVGNVITRDRICIQARKGNPDDLLSILRTILPDWLVVDLQTHETPEHILEITKMLPIKLLVINGVGRTGDGEGDLNVVQGITAPAYNNAVYGSQYIILREEIFNNKREPGNAWFVFGGASDKMELLTHFNVTLAEKKAMLVASPYSLSIATRLLRETPNHLVYTPLDEAIFRLMARAKAACVAMGMIVWELIALGVPTWAYYNTPMHGKFANDMAAAHLIRTENAHARNNIKEFLSQQAVIPDESHRPDSRGAYRVIKLMEDL